MRISINKLCSYILLIVSAIIFCIAFFNKSIEVKAVGIFVILISNMILSFENIKKNVLFLLFNISFFLFLFSRFSLNIFLNYESTEYGMYGTNFTNMETINFMLDSLYISLFFLVMGYLFFSRINFTEKKENKDNSLYYFKISSMLFFVITFLFKFIYIKDQSSFVSSTSYYDFFLSYQSNLPRWIVKLAEMNLISYVAFISSKPNKKEFRIITGLFLLVSLYSMTVGRRIEFMLNILLIVIYLTLKNDSDSSKKLSFKNKLTIILGSPFLLILLNSISSKRDSIHQQTLGLFGNVKSFLFSQGVTVNLIGYTYEFKDTLPKGKLYSFGPLIEFVQSNVIYKKIFGSTAFSGQTVERAMEGNLFAHTISYYIMPTAYLLGRGYGSSYIAEVYYDFGFIGLITANIFIGMLLSLLPRLLNKNNWILNIFSFMFMRNILLIPRAEFISFVSNSITFINILGILMIYFLGITIKRIKKEK
ncbi:O-antigen polysaccharide polymerase Wzy family protein [Vagococcus hydrophili]|uniref:O-antigen polysaccharide polymerase Wzy family protein n=1 Tax=Vagococcus hydrophili TaxID=2714947 RepID=A0A6G8AR04_9ENTE|nr:O-antigen polysaccharide polymerase Wzy family protein [Vagococcus hydrophili]QIL47426.1 O-antigen polysaccharide polymerase Wzy family protein [Vagococcus hydrophili]